MYCNIAELPPVPSCCYGVMVVWCYDSTHPLLSRLFAMKVLSCTNRCEPGEVHSYIFNEMRLFRFLWAVHRMGRMIIASEWRYSQLPRNACCVPSGTVSYREMRVVYLQVLAVYTRRCVWRGCRFGPFMIQF